MIPKETIQNIIDTARIDEVVGDFVQLKRRGANMLGLCPFHNEKTPSFTVSPAKGIYKCFGCGKAGNAVNFIMDHEKYSYPEALRFLADKYNIEIEEQEPTPEEIAQDTEREGLFALNTFAQKYFSRILHESEEGKAVGLTYFKERGFREDIIRKFQLGFSASAWDAFTREALNSGYSEKYLITSGLTIKKDDRLYDRFRERVIFPIHNLTGKVIGFGGRTLSSDKNKPKYVNSPESEVYNKSKSLYGIWLARNAMVAKDNCLLVEGYTDVISLYQSGIENVVSSSGTSLTTDQIRLIHKFTRNITILYDGDPAGIKASFRGIDMILEQGLNVKVVLFPDGDDPDAFARKHRSVEVETFISENANDFIAFKTRLLLNETQGDPIKKAALIHEIIQTISLIPDPIIRPLYIRECAEIMDMDEQTLMHELNKQRRKKIVKGDKQDEELPEPEMVAPPASELPDISDASAQEKDIIRLLLLYGTENLSFKVRIEGGNPFKEEFEEVLVPVAQYICNDLRTNQITFDSEVYQFIFDAFAEGADSNALPEEKFFLMHADKRIADTAIDLITPRYELSPGWEEIRIYVPTETDDLENTIVRSLLSLIHRKLSILIYKNQQTMKVLDNTSEVWSDLLSRDIYYKRARNEINRRLGRILNG
ncbi:MAG: DNA primase [Lentimicrobiaceae bacterium]|nr:DNA primase [Lentimicrobiaceae bacterium]